MAKIFTKLNLADIVATSGGKSFRKLSTEEPIDNSLIGTWKVKEGTRTNLPFNDIRVQAEGTFYFKSSSSSSASQKTMTALGNALSSIVGGWQEKYQHRGLSAWNGDNIATGYQENGNIYCTETGYSRASGYAYTTYPQMQSFTITSVDTSDPNYQHIKEWLKTNATKVS